MRCLLAVLLLTACSESHLIGDFDSGPSRVDAATFDAPSFDVPSFDVPSFDSSRADVPPRRDAGRRDVGPVGVDTGPVFDGGRDAGSVLDVPAECIQLCERAELCVEGTDVGECIDGCFDIEAFVRGPACERLANNLFRCVESVSCEELERVFDGGECAEALQDFGDRCGEI
ncbi:MAG: hypothetical protein ACI9KE_000544 [Polyangiales bacterium]|jgi:hypothetical protein